MLKTQGLPSLEQIRAFLKGSQALGFEAPARKDAYDWIAKELRRFNYLQLGKADKGLVRRYLEKVTGLSRAQMTRLIQQFRTSGRIRDRRGTPAKPFPRRYTPEDIRLLAELDALHGTLSGPATRKLGERRRPAPRGPSRLPARGLRPLGRPQWRQGPLSCQPGR